MRISTFFYTLRQGVRNMFRNAWFSLASIATIASCLLLFGIFYSVVANFQNIVKNAEAGVAVTVFFDEGLSDEEYGAWSPYGVYGGTTFDDASVVPCNDNPDAYIYYYFVDEASGIQQVSNATTSKTKIYSLDGREQKLTKGLNIVRNGNTVRKVIIK